MTGYLILMAAVLGPVIVALTVYLWRAGHGTSLYTFDRMD